ncbi:MAG: hypothetical protein K6T30_06100, partial [Alicyclobacillus sp.]|nr:hypothetical protein [Alicyclobacillus sp.]
AVRESASAQAGARKAPRSRPNRQAARVGNRSFSDQYPEVVERLQKGDEPAEIARQLGVGVSEVELVQHMLLSS